MTAVFLTGAREVWNVCNQSSAGNLHGAPDRPLLVDWRPSSQCQSRKLGSSTTYSGSAANAVICIFTTAPMPVTGHYVDLHHHSLLTL